MSALSVFLKGAAKKLVEDGAEMAVKKDAKAAVRGGAERAVKRAERKALPAPAKRLALPAPNPKDVTAKRVSESKFKPKGGQWVAASKIEGMDGSPETAVRRFRKATVYDPENLWAVADADKPPSTPLGQWLEKALTRYAKRDMGTEDDPVLGLIDRGLGPQGIPDRDAWTNLVNDYVGVDSAGDYLGLDHLFGKTPAEVAKLRAGPGLADVNSSMPWLNKLPSTDPVYTMYRHDNGAFFNMGFDHIVDEMGNALDSGVGLPSHLQLNPASLQRMSWPQAVEHAGTIDKWRAAKMAEEQSNIVASNPAFAVHKQYPENNPLGLAWYQIRQPEGAESRDALQQALKSEGDAMGHCVGGYCDDVARGDSMIYSLRDAKGEPHVTIEASPQRMVMSDLVRHLGGDRDLADDHLERGFQAREAGDGSKSALAHALELAGAPRAHEIRQIKGKQNLKPKEDYIPFVQDFIRSGKWGQVNELRNADMVRLPDERYLAQRHLDEIARSPKAIELMGSEENARKNLAGWNLNTFSPEDWEHTKHLFEGYAKGGLVVKRGCDCGCGDLSVRRAA